MRREKARRSRTPGKKRRVRCSVQTGEARAASDKAERASFRQRGVAYKTVNESTAGWSSPGLRLNNVEASGEQEEEEAELFLSFPEGEGDAAKTPGGERDEGARCAGSMHCRSPPSSH